MGDDEVENVASERRGLREENKMCAKGTKVASLPRLLPFAKLDIFRPQINGMAAKASKPLREIRGKERSLAYIR